MTGERCSKLVIKLLNSVLFDLRLLRVAFFLVGLSAHSCCRIETCERRNWVEFCVPVDGKRRESLRGTVAEPESAVLRIQLWSSSLGGGHGLGDVPLAVCSFERMFVVSVTVLFLLVRFDNICVKSTRWVVAGWNGGGGRKGRERGGGGGEEGLTDGFM